ncbi:hypothetical protein [Enterobacter sichuanensis]|uniref:hypothetical protein n=1 Tax=Enterobacter sichuanensis TaxID=2071710 RepID=UPI002A82CB9B|nr:hypothetical protein [Enterobacter sichuanensis]
MNIKIRDILSGLYYTTIFITLLFCMYLMCHYFYFKDNKPLDLGAISTWVSATCSIATLLVALVAVLNWSKKKDNDEAYDLAKKVIVEDFYKTIVTMHELKRKVQRIHLELNGKLTIVGFQPHNPIRNRNELIDHLADRDAIHKQLLEKKYNLMAIQKLGYTLDGMSKTINEMVNQSIRDNLQQLEYYISNHDDAYKFINSANFFVNGYNQLHILDNTFKKYNGTFNMLELKFALFMAHRTKFFDHFKPFT